MLKFDENQTGRLVSTLLSLTFSMSLAAAERPNIVFIFSDDHAVSV
jgi:hypothetical protein